MQIYKLSFATRNAKCPVYFNSAIDTLFLREYVSVRDYTEEQVQNFIDQLPDKDQIRNLMISFNATTGDWYSPRILEFPNLKEVTIVRRVLPECLFRCYLHSDPLFYYVRDRFDSSATPNGRTHILDAAELRRLGTTHCADCRIPEEPTLKGGLDISFFLHRWRAGRFGNPNWKVPVFAFKGVSYDRISEERIWYSPWGYKVHRTRNWTRRARSLDRGGPEEAPRTRARFFLQIGLKESE